MRRYLRKLQYASDRGREDLITELPGAQFESSFAQFSGYLDVSETKKSFYWFMTTRDVAETLDKPLVMWTNGGPGCSGLMGLFTEHGAFRPTEDLTLESFSYAWNKVANMLYIESPTGVGFSYGDTAEDYLAGDMSTATIRIPVVSMLIRSLRACVFGYFF